MDNKELTQRLVNYDEEEIREVNNEQSEQQDISSEGFVFDLNKIPKKVLNRAWTRYRPYLYAIDRDSLLNTGVYECKDYAQQAHIVRNELVKFFPLKRDLFKIFPRHHKMFAILVANMEDNAEVVQKIMENNGFFRSRPTDEEVKKDEEGRVWRQMWFEPKKPDDITEEIHRRFPTLYYLTPSVNEEKVKREGLKVSNNNPHYRYSESRVFMMEGGATEKEIQHLTNELYQQAQDRHKLEKEENKEVPDFTPNYSLITFDLDKMGPDIRFFYALNTHNGLYSIENIPPEYIKGVEKIVAKGKKDKKSKPDEETGIETF